MPRPSTKQQLLAAASQEFERLWEAVDAVEPIELDEPGVCGDWSVKDLLAHLDAWHELFLEWERIGAAGDQPAVPAPGFTFRETPVLNDQIFERCRHDTWKEVTNRLRSSHRQVVDVLARYPADDLFAKRRFAWTGSTSVGSYAVSATSSHYAWAVTHVRRFSKVSAPGKTKR